MLNIKSPIPLYHQLADIILAKIRSGEYPAGSRIPSENGLASRYGIGRPTARQATDLLVRKRLLIRKRGSGTFVCEQQKELDLFSLAGTTSAFHKKGMSMTTHILKKIRLKSIGHDPENPFSNEKAYFFSRLSMVEKIPVLIEDIYLHDTIFTGIDKMDLSHRSLAQIVDEQYYMQPIGGVQNFRIGYLNGKNAQNLEVAADTPILMVKRFLHFDQAKDAIYSELYCRTDQFVFSQTLGGIDDER
ncbi:MAG: GntR family transcriptional regulator [Deltaproteobacteria bacterium]|nr:GntR family transcriptional regulator [Deltaproteobacteria bacterium]MBW1968690.1 GntR family transcriptional regulator [Deltaproteobacteria bacterium]MBW2198359.1 GntR family transcriptional regulator [Deltaproteobacteria bacterium]MBW2325997.1 GntR family transcriptional regulator [Deltaproteobacteria bacterium]MBW2555816.1 GntR family transcriptional regulator [Deltaproteobacteria bacterium]